MGLFKNPFHQTINLYSRSQATANIVDDLVLLNQIDESNIVDMLQRRYLKEEMYTYIGPVLIAVNPYKMLQKGGMSIYDPEVMSVYKKFDYIEVAPHIFSIASMAYKELLANGQNQCILVTGESGAGKTEASKQLMQYVTKAQSLVGYGEKAKKIPKNSRSEEVTRQLLASNPILESFGNAQTVRNNNSSRFGKYMELQFDVTGTVIGGKITKYLPEKSRVVGQQDGERNFHVFHQLLAGGRSPDLGLDGSPSFRYLMGERRTIPKVDDAAEFKELKDSLATVGVSQPQQKQLFAMLATILWLGNIEFKESHQGGVTVATPKDDGAVRQAAGLLGVSPEALVTALTSHTITGGVGRRGSGTVARLDAVAAGDSRDSLAKAIHTKLFLWLVDTINHSIEAAAGESAYTLGILDIYGFEIFENNSFEQFCINYVNEQLQQYFIELTLKAEQEEYAAEGIEWKKIDFFNNEVVCELIGGQRKGLMATLDDQAAFKGASPEGLVNAFARSFSAHKHFIQRPRERPSATMARERTPSINQRPKINAPNGAHIFGIKHYAGDVTYDTTLFIAKNADTLFDDLTALMGSSSVDLARELFEDKRPPNQRNKRPPTTGSQFKKQVALLMTTLRTCRPHYVRCIKPNEVKKPGVFTYPRNLHQVRYLGLTENVRVRRAGFCYREPLRKFLNKYKLASKSMWPNPPLGMASAKVVRKMLTDGKLGGFKLKEGEGFVIGRTKVFIREPTDLFKLQQLRNDSIVRAVVILQTYMRAYLKKCRLLDKKQARGEQVDAMKQCCAIM